MLYTIDTPGGGQTDGTRHADSFQSVERQGRHRAQRRCSFQLPGTCIARYSSLLLNTIEREKKKVNICSSRFSQKLNVTIVDHHTAAESFMK